jgi:LysR family transcriptional regulator, transcription activator of glutamate synthase operon
MTTDQLRYFVAVAQGEHVTRAACALHVSQPALSRALGRLEAELGVPLFHRAGRVVRLTSHGRLFLDHARRALAELDAGRRLLADALDPGRGEVPLAFLHTLGSWLAPALIGAYRAQRPDVAFRLHQGSAAGMERELRDGQTELILTSPRPLDAALAWRPLLTEPLCLAVAPDHRLAARRRVRLEEVADEPWVVLAHGYGLRATTEELCRRAGFSPRVAFEGEDVVTLRGLVGAGLGVALVPLPRSSGAPIPTAAPHLAVADRGCSRTVGLAWHRERYRPPVTEAFRAFVTGEGRAIVRAPGIAVAAEA